MMDLLSKSNPLLHQPVQVKEFFLKKLAARLTIGVEQFLMQRCSPTSREKIINAHIDGINHRLRYATPGWYGWQQWRADDRRWRYVTAPYYL